MNSIFPRYTASFPCDCAVQEATKRITKAVACQHNNLKIINVCYTGIQKIVLSTSTEGYLYYNSFMPIVSIEFRKMGSNIHASILFELKNSTKVLLGLYFLFALLFETILVVLLIMNRLATFTLLFLPFSLVVLSYTLSTVGLYCSSRRILEYLFMALTYEHSHEHAKSTIPSIKSQYQRNDGTNQYNY